MKPFIIMASLCFLSLSSQGFSQNEVGPALEKQVEQHLLDDPTVPFSKRALAQVAGVGSTRKYKGLFSCIDLLSKTWAYPDAKTVSFCYTAETECMGYLLIKQSYAQATPAQQATYKKQLEFAFLDAQTKLRACMLGLESGLQGSNLYLPPTGSYVPEQNLFPSTSPPRGKK